MPTYEYRCPEGHDVERFYRKISDATPQVECPVCGKTAERIMSAGGGLLFKGSGFYLTDYGKDAHKKKAPGESKGDGAKADSGASGGSDGAASSGGGSGGDSGSSDAKPAKTAESKPAPKSSSGE